MNKKVYIVISTLLLFSASIPGPAATITVSNKNTSRPGSRAVTPTLGNYPNTTVTLGADTTITPDAAPTGATSINVSTHSNFKGTFVANTTTGVVRATNAHPAGVYNVTIKAFGPGGMMSTTFNLTVTSGSICNGTFQFTNAADVTVGLSPRSVAVGDFNNDGIQDLAATGDGSGTVSIRLGNGSGGFSGITNVIVGSSPISVAIGDFNNDGNQDFAASNQNANTVSIRTGDGLGGFSGTTSVGVHFNPRSVAIGDFNNDGNQDLATANSIGSTVSIRLGNGSGGFSGTTNVSVGVGGTGGSNSVAIGDFNNDGNQDFATANAPANLALSTVSIRLGNGSGGFSGAPNVGLSGVAPRSVAIGDFNNDGNQDIASADQVQDADTVSIRLGDGSGGFSGTTDVSVGVFPDSVAIGDFNNDGRQDFATANSFLGTTLSIRLGSCVVVPNTPIGSNVTVQTSDGSITFAIVAQAGLTTFTPIDPTTAGTLPANYSLDAGFPAYNITTTAIYTPPITVCLLVSPATTLTVFNTLRILHNEGGPTLIDRTILSPDTPAPDFATKTICARVNSLSPFVVAQQLSPTAANVSVGGRIVTADANGISNVRVTLTDQSGAARQALTNAFGYFRFDEVETGETYIISVQSKRYQFGEHTQILSVRDEIADLVFIALP